MAALNAFSAAITITLITLLYLIQIHITAAQGEEEEIEFQTATVVEWDACKKVQSDQFCMGGRQSSLSLAGEDCFLKEDCDVFIRLHEGLPPGQTRGTRYIYYFIYFLPNPKVRKTVIVFYLTKTQKKTLPGRRAPPETQYITFIFENHQASGKVQWQTANGDDATIYDPNTKNDTVIKHRPPLLQVPGTRWYRAYFSSQEVITYPNVHSLPPNDQGDPSKYQYHVNAISDKLYPFLIQTDEMTNGKTVTQNFLQLGAPTIIFSLEARGPGVTIAPPTNIVSTTTTTAAPTTASTTTTTASTTTTTAATTTTTKATTPKATTTTPQETTNATQPTTTTTESTTTTEPTTEDITTTVEPEQEKGGVPIFVWILLAIFLLLLLGLLIWFVTRKKKSDVATVTPVSTLETGLRSSYDPGMGSTVGEGSDARSTFHGMTSTVGSNIDGRSTIGSSVLSSSSIGSSLSTRSKLSALPSNAPSSSLSIRSKLASKFAH